MPGGSGIETTADAPARPAVPLLEEDVNYWLRQFGGESALSEFLARESGGKPAVEERRPDDEKPSPSEAEPLDNPFPPGYGDDLLREL